MAKMNSLLDPAICRHLYRASLAGVRIKLCVRGICCVRPGKKGVSENIEVISIVDRFLEHSRIFYFRNGGQEEVYLASADWMPRNLDRRIEIMFPVLDDDCRARVVHILNTVFRDNRRSWTLQSDGSYTPREPAVEKEGFRCQEVLMAEAVQTAEDWRLKKRSTFKPKGPGTAPGA